MPRTCTVCTHPQRSEIEAALLDSASLRDIARQWRVSKDALARHKSNCLPAHLSQAKQAEVVCQADDLLGRLMALVRETQAILQEARTERDNELALKAITRAEKQIELQARLLGELQEGQTINVIVTPEWQRIRTILLSALSPFQDARLAVVAALQEVTHDTDG